MIGINIIPKNPAMPDNISVNRKKPGERRKVMVIFGNCHFQEIQRNIIQYNEIRRSYLPHYICINSYLDIGRSLTDKTYFIDEHIKLFKNADILIYQNIETDRGFLNNKEVYKLIPSNCIKIKIPHYACNIYHYSLYEEPFFNDMKNEVNKIKNIKDKVKHIKNYIDKLNNKTYDTNKFDTFIKKSIEKFKLKDSYSDVSMYNFFINNYKKYQLFNLGWYPSSIFIYVLSKKILEKLNIYQNLPFYQMISNRTSLPIYFSQHTNYPMFDYWYKYNNFTFQNKFFWDLGSEMKDYEFYYLNIDICNRFEEDKAFKGVVFIRSKFDVLQEVNKLRKLINNN